MKKVYDIFNSATVEDDVRKSSAEQLAIILQGILKHDLLFKDLIMAQRIPHNCDTDRFRRQKVSLVSL